MASQEANLVEEVEDSPDFWSGPIQSYNSPVEHRFLIGLDRSTNGPLPDCDRKYVSVRTMPPGLLVIGCIPSLMITFTDSVDIGNNSYRFVKYALQYTPAMEYCAGGGGHLASFETLSEWISVKDHIQSTQGTIAYLSPLKGSLTYIMG